MRIRIIHHCLNIALFLLISKNAMGSIFTIIPFPGTVLPTSILKGQTATAYYLVQNNTSTSQKNNYVRLPPNVSQIVEENVYAVSCNKSFELVAKGTPVGNLNDPQDSCVLQLEITGQVDSNDSDPTHHLAVCQNDLDCSPVDDKKNELNIEEEKPNELTRVAIVSEYLTAPNTDRRVVAYTTTDNGVGWNPNEINRWNNFIMEAVTCEGNHGLSCTAVGQRPSARDQTTTDLIAYTSQDGGSTWEFHTIGIYKSGSNIYSVSCNAEDGKHCVAVGTYSGLKGARQPIVFTSLDAGNNWSPNYPAPFSTFSDSPLTAVSCRGSNGQYCTAVGNFHDYKNQSTTLMAYHSDDGGLNWTTQVMGQHAGPSSLIKSISCNGSLGQKCIAVGQLASHDSIPPQALIYQSNNSGGNWALYLPKQDVGGILNDITCNADTNCLAVGSVFVGNGTLPSVYKSTDGGLTWTEHIEHLNTPNKGVEFSSITCSHKGEYCTIIGYEHYHDFHDNNTLHTKPIVFRTIDGGNNWSHRSTAFVNQNSLEKNLKYNVMNVAGNTD